MGRGGRWSRKRWGWIVDKQTHVDAWIGWHENGAGKLMFSLVDHNPGNLAHTYRIRVEIP